MPDPNSNAGRCLNPSPAVKNCSVWSTCSQPCKRFLGKKMRYRKFIKICDCNQVWAGILMLHLLTCQFWADLSVRRAGCLYMTHPHRHCDLHGSWEPVRTPGPTTEVSPANAHIFFPKTDTWYGFFLTKKKGRFGMFFYLNQEIVQKDVAPLYESMNGKMTLQWSNKPFSG